MPVKFPAHPVKGETVCCSSETAALANRAENSKHQAECELHITRRPIASWQHERAVDLLPEGIELQRRVHGVKLRVVEGIVGLEAKLARDVFIERYLAIKRKIPVVRSQRNV